MPGSNDFSIRFYNGGANDSLLKLLHTAFGRWPAAKFTVEPSDHPYRDSLLRNGFAAKKTMQVTIGPYRPDLEAGPDVMDDPRAAVHFMGGDTDIV